MRAHPGPDGRHDDRDRGVREGHPGHQGLRPEQGGVRALRRAIGGAPRHPARTRSGPHALHLGARADPEPDARRRSVGGRAGRRGQQPDRRRPRRVHHLRVDPRVADRGARLDPRDGGRSRDGRGPRLGGVRHRSGDRRPPGSPPARPRAGDVRFERRRVHLSRIGPHGVARRRSRDRARRDPRARRRDGCRQDDDRDPARPALRPERGSRAARRSRSARRVAPEPARSRRDSRSRNRPCSPRACART